MIFYEKTLQMRFMPYKLNDIMENNPILIAYDDLDVGNFLEVALKKVLGSGKPIIQVADGKELLLLVSELIVIPELIVLDMVMSIFSGDELVKVLRRISHLEAVPVVVLIDDRLSLEIACKVGADAFYTKPTTMQGFVEIVRDIQSLFFDNKR